MTDQSHLKFYQNLSESAKQLWIWARDFVRRKTSRGEPPSSHLRKIQNLKDSEQ